MLIIIIIHIAKIFKNLQDQFIKDMVTLCFVEIMVLFVFIINSCQETI